jgi:predicted RNase H-like HicB family nuclease
MEYSVLIEKITEEGFPEGYYYAHIPTLDITTHGEGIKGAMEAARELATLWIQEKIDNNESIPTESESYFSRLEVNAF